MAVALAIGCAETQDPIDRTEVNALSKSLFTGEWYYNQTVVDVPGARTGLIPGGTNYMGMHRIRWDIQERWLYARKSYEHVRGAEGVDEDTGEFKGSIVAAWPITSHFDIKRGYNPTTGEENNVLTENTSDCKWFDCKYIRVDWSKNSATEYAFIDADEDVVKEPLPYYHEDDGDPAYAPVFDEKNGYIDVTTALAINPGTVSFEYRGKTYTYPTCWLFSGETAECTTQVARIRNSFMRRHPNRDYLPREHYGEVTEWFGFFDSARLTWDTKTGITQRTRQRYINRHNHWREWHYKNQACTTNDDCKEAGSECDLFLGFHKNDVWTDTDADGLPDSFEELVGLDKEKVDSDGDGQTDANDDSIGIVKADGSAEAQGNNRPDLYDYYVWASYNKEFRCTIPEQKRDPRPIAYFNDGDFPRDLVCDKEDTGDGPCKPWQFHADAKVREAKWSALHHVSNNYEDAWWKIFLRGSFGWSQERFDLWIQSRNPQKMNPTEQKVLALFGDINDPNGTNRPTAFTICPNAPAQDDDPWPCRFNRKTWSEAKVLIDEGKDTAENRPKVRPGDIRFNQVKYVKEYYDGWRLLGYGPSHTDSRTGENLAGVANVYALNDWAANRIREQVELLNGTITPLEYVNGVDMTNWINRVKEMNGKGQQRFQRSFNSAQLNSMYSSMVQPWMSRVQKLGDSKEFAQAKDSQGRPLSNSQLRRALVQQTAASGLFDPSKFSGGGLDLIKGTDIEKRLIDNEVLLASGYGPTQVTEITDSVLQKASLARGGFLKLLDARERFRYDLSNKHNLYFLSMADEGLAGLAHRMKDSDPTEIFYKARNIIMRAVLTHEMGHTFGLHHNWTGSEDVINFFPDYWRLRTNDHTETKDCTGPWSNPPQAEPKAGDGKLCPFYIKPINDYQLGVDQKNASQDLKSLYEYSYSSIMDYAGRYTIDGGGLGRYDVAAMMYGQADKVEVYKEFGELNPFDENWFQEWWETDGSATMFYIGRPKAFHYTQWYTKMGKLSYEESNRMLVDYRKVEDVRNPSTGRSAGLFYRDGNKLYPRVPYLFCTYTSGDISEGCNTRDFGADKYERMLHYQQDWQTWYPMKAFTRYQHGYTANGYLRRNFRFYRRLKDYNNIYALYQGLFRQWYKEEDIQGFFTDPLEGWGDHTVAMHDAFNIAMRTLAMPDVKGFTETTEPDGQKIYGEAVFSSTFETDMVNGRYFTTSWSDTDYNRTCGLQWWECTHHFGFYLDKITALYILSDARTYFVARDTAEDIREWRISFFDNFTDQLVDFFGSVLGQTYDQHSPFFDPSKPKNQTIVDAEGNTWNNGVAYRDYADPKLDVKKPLAGRAIEPATRFTLQMYMGVLGFLLFQNNFDNQFVERSLLWKKGAGFGWDIKPTEKVKGLVEYVDPFTGYTYVGADYVDSRGIAQKMIAYANKLKARSPYCNQTPGNVDSCEDTAGTGNPPADPNAESALYDYTQLMDIMVKLTERYKGWATWSWNPFDP